MATCFREGQPVGFAVKVLQVLGWTCCISLVWGQSTRVEKTVLSGELLNEEAGVGAVKGSTYMTILPFCACPKIHLRNVILLCVWQRTAQAPLAAIDHCAKKAGLCPAGKSHLCFLPSFLRYFWPLSLFPALSLHNPERYSLSQISTVSVDENFQIAPLNLLF